MNDVLHVTVQISCGVEGYLRPSEEKKKEARRNFNMKCTVRYRNIIYDVLF